MAYTEENTQALTGLLSAVNASAHTEIGHLPSGPLAEIYPVGAVTTEIELGDGKWMQVAAPLLSISPFLALEGRSGAWSDVDVGAPCCGLGAAALDAAAHLFCSGGGAARHRYTRPAHE